MAEVSRFAESVSPGDRQETIKRAWSILLEQPPARRASKLRDDYATPSWLHDELQRLLRVEERFEALEVRNVESLLAGRPSPKTIGPYRVKGVLGCGGMGVVFHAQQSHPIAREVAIKVLHPSRRPESLLARFEVERTALSRLDHRGIARILDAGADASEAPYLVMELVHGCAITEFSEQHGLSLRGRVGLVAEVARALDHAHGRGLIHRDVKPTNILVAETPDGPQPKIIDFGVAKLIEEAQLDSDGLLTAPGQLIGTLEYMTPEQFTARPGELDVRVDVYALGIVLYELVTGRLPQASQDLRGRPLNQMLSIASNREIEPPGTSASPPAGLPNTLPRDLTAILTKACRKNRSERYRNAADLADDLDRFLRGDAVQARMPSRVYRLKHTIRRHAVAISVTLLLALSLVTATVVSLQSRADALAERDRAVEAEQVANDVTGFLRSVLNEVRSERLGRNATLGDLLLHRARDLESRVGDDPLVLAHAAFALGEPLFAMGEYADAERLFELGEELSRTGTGAPELWLWRRHCFLLGQTRAMLGKLDPAAEVLESLLNREGDRQDSRITNRSLTMLANIRHMQGRFVESRDMKLRVLTSLRRESEPDPNSLSFTLRSLAKTLIQLGEAEEAVPFAAEALAVSKSSLPPGHAGLLQCAIAHGESLLECGRNAEALASLDSEVGDAMESMDPEHPELFLARVLRCVARGRVEPSLAAAKELEQIIHSSRSAASVQPSSRLVWRSYAPGLLAGAGLESEAREVFTSTCSLLERLPASATQHRSQVFLNVGVGLLGSSLHQLGADQLQTLIDSGETPQGIQRRARIALMRQEEPDTR